MSEEDEEGHFEGAPLVEGDELEIKVGEEWRPCVFHLSENGVPGVFGEKFAARLEGALAMGLRRRRPLH